MVSYSYLSFKNKNHEAAFVDTDISRLSFILHTLQKSNLYPILKRLVYIRTQWS